MPKKTKVTTRDIAAKCGLSQTTVSMILSEKEGIHFSEATIEQVRKAAEDMGYKYKRRAPKKENLANKTIMIMVPSLSSQYYTTIISAVTEYTAKYQLNVSICTTMRQKQREEYYIRLCEQAGFYGIICTYPAQAIDSINNLYKRYPFVMISDYNPDLKVGLVELDSHRTGQIIAEHLIKLGHKKIAYMSTPLKESEIPRIRRLEGMRDAFEKAGLGTDAVEVYSLTDYQWQNYCTGNRYYDAGVLLTEQYLREPTHVTAFVGNNDIIAIGVMDSLQKHGYKIPSDFSVCGFDNTLDSGFYGISLTTIDHSIDIKGKDAVDMIMNQKKDLLTEKIKKQSPVMRLLYEPVLLPRNSTGPAKS